MTGTAVEHGHADTAHSGVLSVEVVSPEAQFRATPTKTASTRWSISVFACTT